jgi:hypothetical protein
MFKTRLVLMTIFWTITFASLEMFAFAYVEIYTAY